MYPDDEETPTIEFIWDDDGTPDYEITILGVRFEWEDPLSPGATISAPERDPESIF